MGENHTKPTKQQLEEGMKKSLEEAEKLKDKQDNPEPTPSEPIPSPTPSEPVPSPSEPIPSPSPSEPIPSPSPSAAPDDDDEDELAKAKKKASASAREAQVLHSRTKKYDEAVAEAEKVEPPTEEEMIAEYGQEEWDGMSMGQKKLAINTHVSNKRFEIMSKVSKEGRDIQQWNEAVDKFIDNPKTLIAHPQLERKQEEFKAFAAKPTRRGLEMEDLVLAFLGEQALKPKKKNKGSMMEKGSAGRKEKPKPNDGMLTAAQGRALMKTDYKKWKSMLKAGKIKNE